MLIDQFQSFDNSSFNSSNDSPLETTLLNIFYEDISEIRLKVRPQMIPMDAIKRFH